MHRLLTDPRFYETLFQIDCAESASLHGSVCEHCGEGVLHVADYARSPRGCPAGLVAGFELRHSFCCSVCRCRTMPPSVRFLGRRWYLAAVVLVVSALMNGVTKSRLAQIRGWVGERISRRTLERWRRWWRRFFPTTPTWQAGRGRFAAPVSLTDLPGSLVAAFSGDLRARVSATLRLLGPLTTTSGARLLTGRMRR